MNNIVQFNMHITYRYPREHWAALGKTQVSNKYFEKCPFFGTFTPINILKEIEKLHNILHLRTSVLGCLF